MVFPSGEMEIKEKSERTIIIGGRAIYTEPTMMIPFSERTTNVTIKERKKMRTKERRRKPETDLFMVETSKQTNVIH